MSRRCLDVRQLCSRDQSALARGPGLPRVRWRRCYKSQVAIRAGYFKHVSAQDNRIPKYSDADLHGRARSVYARDGLVQVAARSGSLGMRRIAQTLGGRGGEPHRDDGSRHGGASGAPSSAMSAPRAGHLMPTSALRRETRSPRAWRSACPAHAWHGATVITVGAGALVTGIDAALKR